MTVRASANPLKGGISIWIKNKPRVGDDLCGFGNTDYNNDDSFSCRIISARYIEEYLRSTGYTNPGNKPTFIYITSLPFINHGRICTTCRASNFKGPSGEHTSTQRATIMAGSYDLSDSTLGYTSRLETGDDDYYANHLEVFYNFDDTVAAPQCVNGHDIAANKADAAKFPNILWDRTDYTHPLNTIKARLSSLLGRKHKFYDGTTQTHKQILNIVGVIYDYEFTNFKTFDAANDSPPPQRWPALTISATTSLLSGLKSFCVDNDLWFGLLHSANTANWRGRYGLDLSEQGNLADFFVPMLYSQQLGNNIDKMRMNYMRLRSRRYLGNSVEIYPIINLHVPVMVPIPFDSNQSPADRNDDGEYDPRREFRTREDYPQTWLMDESRRMIWTSGNDTTFTPRDNQPMLFGWSWLFKGIRNVDVWSQSALATTGYWHSRHNGPTKNRTKGVLFAAYASLFDLKFNIKATYGWVNRHPKSARCSALGCQRNIYLGENCPLNGTSETWVSGHSPPASCPGGFYLAPASTSVQLKDMDPWYPDNFTGTDPYASITLNDGWNSPAQIVYPGTSTDQWNWGVMNPAGFVIYNGQHLGNPGAPDHFDNGHWHSLEHTPATYYDQPHTTTCPSGGHSHTNVAGCLNHSHDADGNPVYSDHAYDFTKREKVSASDYLSSSPAFNFCPYNPKNFNWDLSTEVAANGSHVYNGSDPHVMYNTDVPKISYFYPRAHTPNAQFASGYDDRKDDDPSASWRSNEKDKVWMYFIDKLITKFSGKWATKVT